MTVLRFPGVESGARLDNPVNYLCYDTETRRRWTEPNPDYVHEESDTYFEEILVERSKATGEIVYCPCPRCQEG